MHRVPNILVPIVELDVELPVRFDDGVVSPEAHVEDIIAVKLPTRSLAVQHIHPGNVGGLRTTKERSIEITSLS